MKYEVIDNALSKETASMIKEIMTCGKFPWFYLPFVASENENSSNGQFYFVHMFYEDNNWNSPWSDQIVSPILSVLEPKAIIRIKGNFYPRTEQSLLTNSSHQDYDFSHKGAIYYVNSNNGFTILEDGTKIESVENRLLLFDPSLYHHSTHCTDQNARININFNFF